MSILPIEHHQLWVEAVNRLYPHDWRNTDYTYNGIRWQGPTDVKPPSANDIRFEVQRLKLEVKQARAADPQHRRDRREAYRRESDDLFFAWQAGDGTKEEWLAKRAEIAARYPAPEATP